MPINMQGPWTVSVRSKELGSRPQSTETIRSARPSSARRMISHVVDGAGHVVSDLTAASGRWLEPGQPFCTFAINLECSLRKTNGYNDAVYSAGTQQYLLGIQAS